MRPLVKYRELSASEITESALKELRCRGCKVWRQNNLAVRGRKFTGEKGQSDIIGFSINLVSLPISSGYTVAHPAGTFIACEVKTKGDRLSQDQIDFLESVLKVQGIALVACQIRNQVELINFKDYQI